MLTLKEGTFSKDKFNHTAMEREHERMLQVVDMVTRAAGKDVAVAADVHTRLDVPSAIRLVRDLDKYHLLWLEEPVPPENIDAMREVKAHSTTPICAGETSICASASATCSRSKPSTSSCPTCPSAAA